MGLGAGMIMSMARAAAQLAAVEQEGVTLQPERCLHRLNTLSTCSACVTACPVDALALQTESSRTTIVLDQEVCVDCGLCLPVCPVGAFEGDPGTAELLAYVAGQEKRTIVELVCALHPAAEQGPPQSNLVIRSRSCLAALGASTLTALLGLGVYHVLLRVDACASCPLGQARMQIADNAAQVTSLIAADHILAGPVTLVEAVADEWPTRPVVTARTPTKSRRDFFRSLMSTQEPPPQVQQLVEQESPDLVKKVPPERRRLLRAMTLLPAEALTLEPLDAFATTMLAAQERCSACRVCERACPTGAITGIVNEEQSLFALSFRAGACTDCGVCIDLCEPQALARQRMPVAAEWLDEEPVVLLHAALQRCTNCGAAFAGPAEQGLCPVCAFRRASPFGSRLPAWFERRGKSSNADDIHH
jgi:ferredoxin